MTLEMPDSVEKYAESPEFTQDTVPKRLTAAHDTKPGIWGIIRVAEGKLRYVVPGPPWREAVLTPDTPGLIRPTERHWVQPIGDVRFKVEFYR